METAMVAQEHAFSLELVVLLDLDCTQDWEYIHDHFSVRELDHSKEEFNLILE